MLLTCFQAIGYADSAVPHWTAGVASPVRSGNEPHRNTSAAFLCLVAQFMGGRAEGAERLAGAPPVLQTSVRSPTRFVSGLAVHNRNWSNAMFVHSQGATAPSVFSFSQDNAIRVITDDNGELWFCAIDVCEVLNYTNPRKTVSDHCRKKGVTKRDTLTQGGAQALIYINEPNLYRLIIKSRKPEAIRFEEWVMEEVLPALRKHGRYESQEEVLGAFVLMHGNQQLAGERFLVTFSDDGDSYRAKRLENGVCVMTPSAMLKAIMDPNGIYVTTEELFQFIHNCHEKLKQRFQAYEYKKNAIRKNALVRQSA